LLAGDSRQSLIGGFAVDNEVLVLAQKIIDMLDETDSSGMEKWDALNMALRLVDIHEPKKIVERDSSSSQAQGDSDSWPSIIE
jgi:hypothetical protein